MRLFVSQQINNSPLKNSVNTPLLKPQLYAESTNGPVLLGGECECGYVFFPMQTFGCERCGKSSTALKPRNLRGVGRLMNSTIVHMHADKRRTPPFAIGTIALDDGPVIRTLLVEITDAVVGVQPRVQAVLMPVSSEDGSRALDLRFKLSGTA